LKTAKLKWMRYEEGRIRVRRISKFPPNTCEKNVRKVILERT
jgi:hypothetical protein